MLWARVYTRFIWFVLFCKFRPIIIFYRHNKISRHCIWLVPYINFSQPESVVEIVAKCDCKEHVFAGFTEEINFFMFVFSHAGDYSSFCPSQRFTTCDECRRTLPSCENKTNGIHGNPPGNSVTRGFMYCLEGRVEATSNCPLGSMFHESTKTCVRQTTSGRGWTTSQRYLLCRCKLFYFASIFLCYRIYVSKVQYGLDFGVVCRLYLKFWFIQRSSRDRFKYLNKFWVTQSIKFVVVVVVQGSWC